MCLGKWVNFYDNQVQCICPICIHVRGFLKITPTSANFTVGKRDPSSYFNTHLFSQLVEIFYAKEAENKTGNQ